MTKSTSEMTVPTVHLNGTGKAGLLEQQREVWNAAEALLRALAKATPHGRDYYPQGPDALTAAQAEHHEACKLVRELSTRAEARIFAISQQGKRT